MGNFKKFNHKKLLIYLVAVLLVAFFCYLFFLHLPKTFINGDDWENYRDSLYKNNFFKVFTLEYIDSNGSNTYYTPTINILFLIIRKLFNINPLGYYIFTLSMHLINTFFLYLLLRKLKISFLSSMVSSILFLYFPYNFDTIKWISAGFGHPVATFFMLATIISYINFKTLNKKYWLALTILLYLFGCFTKSSFYLFFLVLILYDYIFNCSNKDFKEAVDNLIKSIKNNLIYLIISIPFLVINAYRFKMGFGNRVQNGIMLDPLMIIARILDYGKNILWQASDYNIYINTIVFSLLFWGAIYCLFYSKNKIAKFSICWMVVIASAFSTVYLPQIHDLVGRYVYSFSIGAFALVASLFELRNKNKISKLLYLLPLVLFSIYFNTILISSGVIK